MWLTFHTFVYPKVQHIVALIYVYINDKWLINPGKM